MFVQQNCCRIYIFSSEINNNKSLEYFRTVGIYTRSCCPLVLSVRSIPTAPLLGSPTSTKRVLHVCQRTDKVNEQSHVVLMDTDNKSQERCCPSTYVCSSFNFHLIDLSPLHYWFCISQGALIACHLRLILLKPIPLPSERLMFMVNHQVLQKTT